MDEETRKREISFLEFELQEIEEAGLRPGEDEELEKQYKKMSSGRNILEAWQSSKGIREMITVHRIWWAGRYRRQTGCWEWMNLCNRLPVCYRMWKSAVRCEPGSQ